MGAGFAQVRLLFVVTVFDISHTKKSVFYHSHKNTNFVERRDVLNFFCENSLAGLPGRHLCGNYYKTSAASVASLLSLWFFRRNADNADVADLHG
jgi:hypothetical protein